MRCLETLEPGIIFKTNCQGLFGGIWKARRHALFDRMINLMMHHPGQLVIFGGFPLNLLGVSLSVVV